MKVDNNGVDEGLVSVEAAHDLVKKAISNVENASSSLDSRLRGSISGFSGVISLLNSVSSTTLDVMIKCNEYISDTLKAILYIQGLSPGDFGEISYDDILNAGKGPLNKKLLENPSEYAKKIQQDAIRADLLKRGFTETDIDRVLNGEISSIEELFSEIVSDKSESGRERYRNFLEAQYLQQCQFSASTSGQKLEELNNEKKDIEKRLGEINDTLGKHQSKYYKRLLPEDGIIDGDLYIERKALEERNKQLNREIVELTQKIEGYGNTDFEFDTMSELETAIKECDSQINELLAELNELKNSRNFASSFGKVVSNLAAGGSYDVSKNTTVAYKYEDEKGNVQYDYRDIDTIQNDINFDDVELTPTSYDELYGDKAETKELLELLNDNNGNHFMDMSNSLPVWELVERVNTDYEDVDNRIKELEKEVNELAQKREVYTGIKENIDSQIDYFLANVAEYIYEDDFVENSTFNKDYEILNNYKELDELYDKYCNQEGNNLSEDQKKQKYDEYTGLLLSYIVNSSTDIKDDNYIRDNYAVGLSYPDISDFGYTSKYKENAIDYCRKWRKIMTESEIASFNYICNTKGYAEGYNYLVNIIPALDNRYIQGEREKDANYAHEHPFLASLGSIFKKPIEGIGGAMYSVGCLLNGVNIRKSNTYSVADIWRGTVSEDIKILNGDVASFFYNTSMSMSDTGLVIALTTLTGGSGNFLFSTGVMGSSVYLSTLNEALERGLDDTHAVALALGSSAIESIMEGYSVGHLVGLEKEFSEVLQNSKLMDKIITKLSNVGISSTTATNLVAFGYCALDQALVEGDEELWTEIADNWLDCVIAGVLNDKDLSKKALYIENYKKTHPGCSDAEAYANQLGSVLNDSGMAWLGGATSGVLFGFGKGASTVKNNNAMYRMYNQYLNQRLDAIQAAFQERILRQYGLEATDGDLQQFKDNLGKEISDVVLNDDGTFTVTTKYGKSLIINRDGLNSQNFEYEIKQLNEHHEALLVNDWLLNHIDNIDSLIINDSERQKNIDNYIAKIAKYLGTDSETFKQVYASTFKRIIDESDIGIRVSNDSLLKILTSGEIKNSHTTESERLDTPEKRKQHEEYLFGIPKKIDGQDSPIYGMVFPKYDENDSKSVQFYNYGPGYWYGKGNGELDYSTESVIIFKKDAILDYTTFTNADSFEHGRDPDLLSRYGGIQAPTNAKNPIQTNNWFGMDGIKNIDDLQNATLYNFSPANSYDTDSYIETQIYGRYNHSIDNIDHVLFLKAPSMEVVSKLNELGIKYIIAHHEEKIHNKYTVVNSNGEEITVDAIGVTRDANGVYHDGVMSAFNGVFTERDNVQLEFGDEKRLITIGDISEALNIMTDLITLKKPTNLSETMCVIQETVDMYFGDYSSLETRHDFYPISKDAGNTSQSKVSDLAHQNAASGIERGMLAQNLLKQLGYDSTFKMSEINYNGSVEDQAFNVIQDNGKYYIFDSAQPTLRNGKIDPIICEISTDVALKMLDPLSSDGVSLSIHRNYNALLGRYSNVIYDAGWPSVEYGYSRGDYVTGFNLRSYRMREMTDLLSMLGSAEIDLKERVSRQIKNIIINNPLMLPSYMYKLDDLMTSDKLDLLQMASTTDKYQTLLHSFDISQESDLYVNHKEELMKIYQNIYNQIIEGKIDYHQFMDSTVPVFKELDPLYPIKIDINDVLDYMYGFGEGQSFIYLLDYSKEILDYSIENNITINKGIIINLLKDEVKNPESVIKLLSSGNYDRSAFDILGMKIMGDKNLIALVASNHPEYLNGYEFKFNLNFKEKNDNLEDIKFILDKTKNIDGITYTIDAYTNNQHSSELNEFLKELHSIVGDKLLIRPLGNTNRSSHTYTYEDFIYRDNIIETYVSALRDKVDVNGNIKSLSPFEKFFAAFIITEKFAKYNLEGFQYDSDLTRSVYEFINKHDNRPICCAGYVSFLHELLERLVYSDGKLNLAHWSVNSKTETNAIVDYDNHDRSLAYLEDLKYKLNAIFMSDPTWDSNKFFATRSPDFRRTVVRHLLKTRDELSTEKSDFSDPLRNMHIESDDDINRIRIDLGLDDSISNEEIISLFNQKITDEQLIYALCAINRFVEKGAPMAKSNSIGQDGYTVDEFNRAVLSLGLEEKFIFDESLTHKSLNEIIKYLDDEYHLDKYEAVCLINEYFTKHNTSDSRLVLSLSSDNQVELDHIYSTFYAKDIDVLFNLPEDIVDEVVKKLNLGLSTESIITLGKYDLSKSLDGISIPSSAELDEIVKIKQAQAHDVLIETMKTDFINKQKMERRQKAEEARIRLDEIAREKGMTLKDLGKQTGDVDPEIKRIADSLAEEVAEKAKSNQKRFEKLVKIYDNGELSGRTFESIQEGIKDGTITEYQVLVGLDRQLKEVSSISRKIIDYAEKHVDNSLSDGASRVHDSLRYTLLIDDDHYVQKIHEVVDDLRDKGYIVNVSNHWGNPAYQGVNATITDRETSFTFELQFHTAESFDAKESVTHTYYEIFRNKYTTAEEKDLANTIQMSAQEDVSVPKGIIGEKFD